jgi:hypothetical protein
MFIQAFSPFNTQRSCRARNSEGVQTFAVAVALAVAAGGGGLEPVPFWTTASQEGAVLGADRLAEAVVCCCYDCQ